MFNLIYVTHKNQEEAEKIVSHLLDMKLIKCANYFPISSEFWWMGKIDKNDEIVTILKTRKENWIPVKDEIKKLHTYDVPCIIKIEAEGSEEYEAWINE